MAKQKVFSLPIQEKSAHKGQQPYGTISCVA